MSSLRSIHTLAARSSISPTNVSQWKEVFEEADGDPPPEAIVAMPQPPLPGMSEDQLAQVAEKWRSLPGPYRGLEAPSSFWPKFEYRFGPAEELWFAEGLPGCIRVGSAADQAKELFKGILAARDELVAVLPADGQTPRTRAGGLAILEPMRRLMEAMDRFVAYVLALDKPPRGWRARRAHWKRVRARRAEWPRPGPDPTYEGLNY
jgi:hypothetical protein